jgi:hypothetical protein
VLIASVEVGSKSAPFEKRKGCGTRRPEWIPDRGRKSRSLTPQKARVRDDRFLEFVDIVPITSYFAFFTAFFFEAVLRFGLDAERGLGGAA